MELITDQGLDYKVIFKKIKNNHDKLCDNIVEGTSQNLPTAGQPFFLIAPLRNSTSFRYVTTSPVKEIVFHIKSKIRFKTERGSTYEVLYR